MGRVKTPHEYERTQHLLEQGRVFGERQRASLQAAGLSPEHVKLAMAPLLSMQDQMQGELDWYDNARKGAIRPLPTLARIGLSLIALRLAKGLTQRQLAERLGVNEAQVSKDEKNEYHGISVERAQRIIDALGGSITVAISADEPRSPELELAKAQTN
jgi:DNA-binding XRE family transcriptional regulator